MHYWLLKSEPYKFSWEDLLKVSSEPWDGVRNFQARNHMKAMKKGDLGFFYHSNVGLEIVGIIKIVKEYHPDPSDDTGKFGMVEVQAICPFKKPVTLEQIKAMPALSDMQLIRQQRLSVSLVTEAQWNIICGLGHTKGALV